MSPSSGQKVCWADGVNKFTVLSLLARVAVGCPDMATLTPHREAARFRPINSKEDRVVKDCPICDINIKGLYMHNVFTKLSEAAILVDLVSFCAPK